MHRVIAAVVIALGLFGGPGTARAGEPRLDLAFGYASATAEFLFIPVRHIGRYLQAMEPVRDAGSANHANGKTSLLQLHADATRIEPTLYRSAIAGNPPFIRFDDTVDYVVHESHRLADRGDTSLTYDARERLWPGSPAQRELVAFWSRRVDRVWKTQVYLLKGLAEGSPDWGAGAFAVYSF
jgi:hypothetical protein